MHSVEVKRRKRLGSPGWIHDSPAIADEEASGPPSTLRAWGSVPRTLVPEGRATSLELLVELIMTMVPFEVVVRTVGKVSMERGASDDWLSCMIVLEMPRSFATTHVSAGWSTRHHGFCYQRSSSLAAPNMSRKISGSGSRIVARSPASVSQPFAYAIFGLLMRNTT